MLYACSNLVGWLITITTGYKEPQACGGYTQNVGLEFTQNWLNSCSDGFLDCSSQTAAGISSTKDTSFTKGREPLSHAQSRRDCFRLDTWLRDRL